MGGRLARLHSAAERHPEGVDYAARVERNLRALRPLIAGADGDALARFARAFLVSADAVLKARAAGGMVLDAGGDLRVVDVADDLGLRLMELADQTGTWAAGDAVMVGYVQAGGHPQPESLVAFFGTYRAQAAARAELARSAAPRADGDAARAHAERLLALSRRLAWRARGQLILLVAGCSEADATTLAAGLEAASGIPVLSADAHVLDRAQGIMELADRVRSAGTAIVDAGGGDARRHGALAALLADGGARRPLLVQCGVAAVRGAAAERLAVGVSASLPTQVDQVEAWLDSLLAAGREG